MKPRRASIALLTLVWALGLAGLPALSALAAEEVYDERTMEIARKLSCPVCEGQTVADSNSRVAVEMRNAIQAQVEAGQSDEQIFDFFRARYGDEVLVEPPREGINLALWWVPVIAVLLGLGVVVLYLRDSASFGRRRPGAFTSSSTAYDQELERIAERVLHEDVGRPGTNRGDRPAESS